MTVVMSRVDARRLVTGPGAGARVATGLVLVANMVLVKASRRMAPEPAADEHEVG